MDLVKTVLLTEPAPAFPPGFSASKEDEDMEDYVERLCEERGVGLVRVHDVDKTTRMFLCHTGGIAAYLHYEVDPQLFEEEEEVVSAEKGDVNVSADLGLDDVFGDDSFGTPSSSPDKKTGKKKKPKKKKKKSKKVSEADAFDDFFGDDDGFGGLNVSRTTPSSSPEKPKKTKTKKPKLPPGKDNVNLVFCGHVDAGKSTTVGHLLVQMKEIDEREVERMKKQDRADR